jgi:hypothetical protein
MVLKVIPTVRIFSDFVADGMCPGAVAASLSQTPAFNLPSQAILQSFFSQGTFTDK